MTLTADQAALLVRATARVSAVILAANLLAAAKRVSTGDPAGHGRHLDVRLFAAFIASHTIHFICVGLLTIATSGANIDARTGYTPVIAVGVLFYVGCFVVMRAKQRPMAGWLSARQRRAEVWPLVAIWLAFVQAYISRPLQSWLFAALAGGLLYALGRFVIEVKRSSVRVPGRVS